jgi:TetR/AcrR family transcriptional regulator
MSQSDVNENRLKEEQILDAACKEFLTHGKNGTRMQQIADTAGVNKALVFYYYHSKDQIFQAVVDRNFRMLIETMSLNVDFAASSKTIIRQFTHNHIGIIAKNKELFQFFSGEIWMNPEELINGISSSLKKQTKTLYAGFEARIQNAIEKHEIRQISPLQLLLNIISLDVFYFIAAPIVFSLTSTSAAEQKKIEQQREDAVFDFIWNAVKYQNEADV